MNKEEAIQAIQSYDKLVEHATNFVYRYYGWSRRHMSVDNFSFDYEHDKVTFGLYEYDTGADCTLPFSLLFMSEEELEAEVARRNAEALRQATLEHENQLKRDKALYEKLKEKFEKQTTKGSKNER